MRISDWSSDVCSSDLARLLGCKESGGRIEVLVERITSPTTALAHIKASKSPKPGSTLILADDAFTATMRGRQGEPFEKIGSAAGRERVCPYVLISVVAVSLKNKKRKTHYKTNN